MNTFVKRERINGVKFAFEWKKEYGILYKYQIGKV